MRKLPVPMDFERAAGLAGAWLLPILTSLFHLLTYQGYGIFRDELYYLACGEHLDFGYVDHPPFIGLVAAIVRGLLGTSLFSIRLLPALAAGGAVWLVGRMARDFGGGRWAILTAQLTAAVAPMYLALFSILSMNAFDILFWGGCFALLIPILRGDGTRSWIPFGVVAGLGLQNKISVLFLGFGLVAGLAAARRWEVLRDRRFWFGGLVAAAIFLPHLIWQAAHGFPTLEFMDNARQYKMAALGPLDFLGAQILQAGPPAAVVWIAGLVFLLRAADGRPWRALGWGFLATLGVMIATGAKAYYLAPAYTVLFAAGGTALERWTARMTGWRRAWRPAALLLVLAGGILTAPAAKPLLSEEGYVRYAAGLGLRPPEGERHRMGRLPQFFADMHGWPELAGTVAGVYESLPPADRLRACIFGQNYGQAGAIDLFGPRLGLPKALSAHNSYFLWGRHGCTGEVLIVIGDERKRLEELFGQVELGATYTCADCMPYEDNKPIWIVRRPKMRFAEAWPGIKRYI